MKVTFTVLMAFMALIMSTSVATAAPFQLSYSGRLTEATGKPVAGNVDLQLKLFSHPTDPTLIAVTIPQFDDVILANGAFQVQLNLTSAEYQTAFGGAGDVWAEVKDVTHDKTYPRQRFLAVPYALQVPVDGVTVHFNSAGQLEALTGGSGDMSKTQYDTDAVTVDSVDLADHATTADNATNADNADDSALLGGQAAAFYTSAANINETATRKWLTDVERTKLTGITPNADMLKSVYDTNNDGKVNSAVAADTATTASNATQLNGQAASYYNDAANLTGNIAYARLPVGTAANTVAAGNDARMTDSRTPNGAAGGGLSGTYPNPTVASVPDGALSANVSLLGSSIALNSEVSNTLPVANGGTGVGTLTGLVKGNGTGAFTAAALSDIPVGYRLNADDGLPADALYVDAAGKVGIGTTTPAYKLQVEGGMIRGNLNATGPSLIVQGTNSNLQVTHDGASNVGLFNSGGGIEFRQPDGTTNTMTVGSTGNVGIGTTTPGAKLDVAGLATATALNAKSGPGTFGLHLANAADTGRWIIRGLNAEGGSNTGYDLSINARDDAGASLSTPFLIQRSTGNVGIGTTAPDFKLHVAAFDTSVQLSLERTGSGVGQYDIGTSNVGLGFWAGGYGADPTADVVFSQSGNVGIGTATPTSALEVGRNAASSPQGIRITGGSTIAAPTLTFNYADAGADLKRSQIYQDNAGDLIVSTATDAGALTERLHIKRNGNVGIGTASPAATLDVNGSISGQGPAGEAQVTTFSAPTGGGTVVTGYTVNTSVGSGFTAGTGIFQPTVAGRYMLTAHAYSGASANWGVAILKNGADKASAGAVAVAGAGYYANLTSVVNLNGSTDTATFSIFNYSGSAVSGSLVRVTWTKIP